LPRRAASHVPEDILAVTAGTPDASFIADHLRSSSMSGPLRFKVCALLLAGAGLLGGCGQREGDHARDGRPTTTASTAGSTSAPDAASSVQGMGGGNPNGQGTGDSSTRSNVPAGALPQSAASGAADNAGLNRGSTNSR
jgi:hypothetical protein